MTVNNPSVDAAYRFRTARLAVLVSLAVLLVSIFGLAGCGGSPDEGPTPSLGKAPAISLPDQNGVVYTLDPEACKPTVIVFYMGYF